ncbi:MAG TPA: hypothetical protein VMW62_01135 [Chloroflexota bacterium]|nr:hypothetical protein [Chloroflexota bacterium]
MSATMGELWEQVDALSRSFYERVKTTSSRLAGTLAGLPRDNPRLLDWLKERVWREREGARSHAYVVVKMADVLDAHALVFLARQAMEEGMHYQYLYPCLQARGATIDGYEPKPSWRRVFKDEFDVADERDPVSLFSSFHMGGEGPASASADVYSKAFLGTAHEDISLAYQQIAPDEAGHWAAGRKALRGYLQTPQQAEQALAVLTHHGEHLFGQYHGRAAGTAD